jgi:AraC-like DNA-binding protein
VWIRHAGSRAFVADPRVVTIYNAGQEYTREAMHPEGDRCDWFGLSAEMAREVARAADTRAPHDSSRPFRFEHAHSDAQLYFRQRILFDRLTSGACDAFEAEEEVLSIVHRVLQLASSDSAGPGRLTDTHRDLAEQARAELVRHATAAMTLGGLAARLHVSPWHLCRVFRSATGTSLHAFRLDLRLRMALERLENPAADISRMAHELGFSSHSHFTAAMRERLGCTPSAFRRSLRAHALLRA